MQGPGEPERIRLKTSEVLTGHHLDWTGVAAGQTFVDFGCASGSVLRTAATRTAGAVAGVDRDPAMLAAARAETAGHSNVTLHEADLTGLGSSGLTTSTWDHAWARFLLEYLPDPVAIVTEMARVVRPGGRVTLIDIEGNVKWHYPLPPSLQAGLDEVLQDLSVTGFDPDCGRRLSHYARAAGLEDVRESVEPYHYVVGAPDATTEAAWQRKVMGMKHNYLERLHPEKVHLATFFDDFLDWFRRADTMTWSLLHLVQGTKVA